MKRKFFQDRVDTARRSAGRVLRGLSKYLEDEVPAGFHKGHVWVKLEHADGSIEEIDLGDNLVVNTAGDLVAQLCKGYAGNDPANPSANVGENLGTAFGITHMALGQGDPSDPGVPLNPAAPDLNDQLLGGEYARKPITEAQYVLSNGTPTVSPTNIVDFITTFERGEATGPLVECGLFGGHEADSDNSGLLFARRTFPVLNLDEGTAITFVWRIFF